MRKRKYNKAVIIMLSAAFILEGCAGKEVGTRVDSKPAQELSSANTKGNAEAGILEQNTPDAPLTGELVIENAEETKEYISLEPEEDKRSAVFVGENGVLNSLQLKIHTTGNESEGMAAVMNGNIYSTDAEIVTEGSRSAGISLYSRNSAVTVTGGGADTAGQNSPCLYTEGIIYANRFTGSSAESEMAVLQNGGSINLTNSSLSGNGIVINDKREDGSMTGLSFLDSTLTLCGGNTLFKVRNANTKIDLKSSLLQSEPEIFLQAADSDVILSADKQTVTGDILCNENSKVSIALKNESSYKGRIDPDNTGDVSVSLEGGSSWILTGDSYVTAITDTEELAHITSNGYNIYYDAAHKANGWLQGMVINIKDGGKLIPLGSVQ